MYEHGGESCERGGVWERHRERGEKERGWQHHDEQRGEQERQKEREFERQREMGMERKAAAEQERREADMMEADRRGRERRDAGRRDAVECERRDAGGSCASPGRGRWNIQQGIPKNKPKRKRNVYKKQIGTEQKPRERVIKTRGTCIKKQNGPEGRF